MKRLLIFFPFFQLLCLSLDAVERRKFTVFITGVTENGFVDPAIADSVNDMRKAISKKVFQIVDSPFQADVTITVTGRRVGSQIIGNQTQIYQLFGVWFASNTQVVDSWCYVFATLQTRGVKKDAYGYGKFWGVTARALTQYFEKFVKTNESQIQGQGTSSPWFPPMTLPSDPK